MRTTRRRFMAFAGAAVASPALLREGHAQAPQVTLKMHHFLPPVSNGHAKFLAPWARKVEADSQGRIKIDIFPSMQLGGTPPQLYDQARDGVADLVWTLPGSTPGRFPGIEVIELPFVAARRGVVNAKATQEFYETQAQLKQEFREVQPICLWAHDHGLVHANKQVKTIDDMKGLKLRSPT
ncbi:MAG: C4-dicarboxylate ABC transporter, partial [Microvirga sp.]